MSRDSIQQVRWSSKARGAALAGMLALATLLPCARTASAFTLSKVGGHLGVGYERLLISDAPAGSIGFGAGVDYPVADRLHAGVDLGFSFYGTNSVERGSFNANIDYSSVEAIAFLHWDANWGPLARISAGPGITHVRAAISTAVGGASFLDLARDENGTTAAVDLTFMKQKPAPVRVALILSGRDVFLSGDDWPHFAIRLGFYY